MTFGLRIVLALACALFLVFVTRMVCSGKMLLRYSILWMLFACVGVLMAAFPEAVYFVAFVCGFETPSNFVFFVCLFLVLLICLSLSRVVSKQDRQIKTLVQELAIEKARSRGLGEDHFSVQHKVPCDDAGHGEELREQR